MAVGYSGFVQATPKGKPRVQMCSWHYPVALTIRERCPGIPSMSVGCRRIYGMQGNRSEPDKQLTTEQMVPLQNIQ